MSEFRTCELCGCNTNAKLRACCTDGRELDRRAGLTEFGKWYADYESDKTYVEEMRDAFTAGRKMQNKSDAEMDFVVICTTNEDGTKCDECLAMEDAVKDYKLMITNAGEKL